MTQLLRRLLGKPGRRPFIQGMGSILDLGGSGKRRQVMVFHARPAGEAVRDAWQVAMGQAITEVKGSK